MKARRRVVGSGARRAAAVVSAVGVLGTGALGGCSVRTFPGVYQECPSSSACADTRAPNAVGPDGPRKLYPGVDPVAAARGLDIVPAWARAGSGAADSPGTACDGGVVKANGEAPAAVRACLAKQLGGGVPVDVGWYVSTVEGDPIVTLGRAEGADLRFVEVTAFDNYGGVNAGPLPEYVCSDVAGFLRSPGIPTEGSSNPGECVRDE